MKSAAVLAVLLSYSSFAFGEARGYTAIESRSFILQQPEPVKQHELRLLGEYDNTFSAEKYFSLKVHPYFQVSTRPEAWGADYILDPRELYLAAEHESYYIQGGYFTLVYEGTDGINPMDIASMKYWGDPLAPITKASAGIHAGYTGNMFEFEAAYIPNQSPSTLPGEESAWYPRRVRFPLRSENIELLLPDKVDYILLNRQDIDHAFLHNYTARVQMRTDYGDAAAAYFEGAADTPLIVPTLDVIPISVSPKEVYQLQSPLRITPRHYRRRTVAGLVTVPVGEWIFRVASRYDAPLGSAKNFTTYSGESVLSIERSVTNNTEDLVTFILQGAIVEAPESTSLISIQDLLDKSVLLAMRWPMGDYWTTQLSALRSFSDESMFYTAQVTRTFATQWSGKLLFEILEGPPQSVMGLYDGNDRVSFELRRSF